MKKASIVLLFFTYIFFNTKAIASNNLEWYNNKIENSKLYIYGVGNGMNLDDATKSALNDIKQDFIKNKAKLENNETNNKTVNMNYLNFSNYEIEKSKKYKNIYYILINIKRNELYNLQLDNLIDINNNIEKQYNFLKDKNDFVKINKFKEILKLIEEAKNKILIIKMIDSFDKSKYIKFYNKIENEYNNLLKHININVIIEKDNLLPLEETIYNNIINNGIKINKKSKNTLYISYITKKLFINNAYNYNILIYCKILDYNNKLMYYNSFNYTYTSNISFKDAKNKILETFENDLKTIKVINYL